MTTEILPERNEFHISDALYKAVPAVLGNIMVHGTNKEKIAAARVIVEIHQQNKSDHQKPTLVAHKHVHEVIHNLSDTELDQKRQELFARIARLG